jgi:hypothetical protein
MPMPVLPWAGWTLDWSTAAVLAGVTLLEGIRRVPADAVILVRLGWDPWGIARTTTVSRPELASWAAPFVLHLLVPPTSVGEPPRELRRRWRRVRQWLPLLRGLAACEWLLVVLGIPLATERWGPLGLLLAVALAFEGALLLLILSACALAKSDVPPDAIARAVRGLLSPFAAPRAPEVVIETALGGVPSAAVLRLLLPAGAFAAWVRPRAYDLAQGLADEALAASVPQRALAAALAVPPVGAAEGAYCPRCGQTYRDELTTCDACAGVGLVLVPRRPVAARAVDPSTKG